MITERQYAPNRFQHCSTISKGPPGSGTFLAYYTGEAEMHQSQHVIVHWISDEGVEAKPFELGDYTGNPILIETSGGTRLIYSKFEDLVPRRIEWWQHCSLWNSALNIMWNSGVPEIVISAPKQIFVKEDGDEQMPPPGLGYLPRCHPIEHNMGLVDDGYLLPLYREHNPYHHGVIMHSTDGIDWTYRGSIGKGTRCIQPTIWHDKKNNKLCSLLRRFSRSGPSPFAYYSESKDGGRTWSKVINSPYYNANNSILCIKGNGEPLIIWNNDSHGRTKISLSTFSLSKPITIAQLDGYGSYPSACVSGNTLHVAYTTTPNLLKTPDVKSVIKYKKYNLDAVLRAGQRSVASQTRVGYSQRQSSSPWQVTSRKKKLED